MTLLGGAEEITPQLDQGVGLHASVVLHREIKMSSREPTARTEQAAIGFGNKLFIWGGCNRHTNIHTSSLESFNVCALKWEQPRQLNGSLPDGLQSTAVTNDSTFAYTYGGYTGSTQLNTLYEINPHMLQCRKLLPNNPSHAPQKTSGCRSVHFRKKLVVYGALQISPDRPTLMTCMSSTLTRVSTL